MVTRIGINGFGRIGRMCLRASLDNPNVEVVAINGTTDTQSMAHLLKYDSVHGRLNSSIEASEQEILVDGRPIRILNDRNPAHLPWGELGVNVVIESTGKFLNRNECLPHLQNGAKKVIITAPAKDEDITIVMGVNENRYNPAKHHIISNASCTTNCLAPVIKVLHQQFGIETCFMTTVHAFTTDQRNLDNSHKDLRRSRSCVQSIVPTSTGAAKAIGLVIPELKGKVHGVSLRVPIPDVSITDIVAELKTNVTAQEVNSAFKKAAQTELKGVLDYCAEPLVSVDFLGNSNSAIIDSLSTMVVGPHNVKVLAWYDNEWGYSCRVIDLAQYVMEQAAKNENDYQKQKIAG